MGEAIEDSQLVSSSIGRYLKWVTSPRHSSSVAEVLPHHGNGSSKNRTTPKVDSKIDLHVGALNLFVKCHGEPEIHKILLDYSKTAFSQ